LLFYAKIAGWYKGISGVIILGVAGIFTSDGEGDKFILFLVNGIYEFKGVSSLTYFFLAGEVY